ncbi:MAG: Cu-processing system permease protein [Gammaproteobacteria bacterium]|jgi:Cu-processing system permease protein
MRILAILAAKEIQDGLRNRWVAASILLLTTLALSLYFLGAAPTGSIKASSLTVTVVSLASLSVYLIPLMALMLSFDALVGEFERGTMLLLLTYPVSRWEVVGGKFIGHMMILALAIVIGYGVTALVIAFSTGSSLENWQAYVLMMLSSWLLGGIFIALGYLISILVKERATAVGAAIGVWIVGVLLYDLGLMGILLADKDQLISQNLFTGLIVANPTDAYRIFNFTSIDAVSQVAGMADIGAKANVNPTMLLLVMATWIVVPLVITVVRFRRREL